MNDIIYHYIDATPSRDYPIRLLESYIDNTRYSSSSVLDPYEQDSELMRAMNALTESRNAMLEEAIDVLRRHYL